ncbi:MAG: universal stress protein [Gammaproteobacteria bacterium]|nr:universal stress protein [Gammaproteobacteria bacterium]MCB1874049.1 universal stress protein [Gammaproteobacteria bacterium]MCB1881324.1 universal stress protein [Gammaproteobacteria bacterium]MCB1902787.1 universal stress protein [Gammaproteobacteria bacterium]
MKIEKILVPTDFSEAAEKAFDYALFLAETHTAEVTILHVVDQLQGMAQYEILALTPAEIAERLKKSAQQSLQAMVERAKQRVSATQTVREGKTWDVICQAAADEHADMIVMASQGRTGLAHALIGSVAESVVRHANCPVLVVREQK